MHAQPNDASEPQSPTESEPTGEERWYAREDEDALGQLDTSREGLAESDAQQRLEKYGRNAIGKEREVRWWEVLLNQFRSPLVYVLLVALVVTISIQSLGDSIVIAAVLIINSVVGFIQEYRAEHSVQALMEMVSPKARVRRENQERELPADQLVPGDVVLIEEGQVIPADLRILESTSLQINEAALTGESVPVNKQDTALEDQEERLPLPEQQNMAFMGTAVTSGHGLGLVVRTGRATQIGQIAEQVEEAGEVQTPLQARISRLTKLIAVSILSISAVAFGSGLLMGRDLFEMLLLAVALSVAAIPAGLPVVVTVALAIGVERMARRHAVIRHLPAVDTLGSCTSILSDKTGTLTRNRMTVKALHAGDTKYDVSGSSRTASGRIESEGDSVSTREHPALYHTLLAGVLCNDAEIPAEGSEEPNEEEEEEEGQPVSEEEGEGNGDDDGEGSGDPMEIALLIAGRKAELRRKDLQENFPVREEIPFRTERRFMATIHEFHGDSKDHGFDGDGPLVLVKGAPEAVLDMCDTMRTEEGDDAPLDRDEWMQRSEALAQEGLRVLAMATGRGDERADSVKSEQPENLTLVGMQGLLDPPRPSAVDAVDDCHRAGIRVMMVTGDHQNTAAAIAREVHLDQPVAGRSAEEPSSDSFPDAHSGREIAELSDEDLDSVLSRVHVFARVEPAQKTRIVNRLKSLNEIVAVTGDGVNDAPALKNAHLGAAMGSGTDVAKESSDMVITDDRFSSVYAAVEQGRTAFRNIRMATFFLLSTGAADVLIILSALMLGWPLPLLPAQILWCNVVTNGIADVALAFEPGQKALFHRPPRPPEEGVLNRNLLERLVLVGVWLAVGVLGVFLWKWGFTFSSGAGREEQLGLARTAALTTLVLFQKVHVFNCRSENVSLFKKNLLANKFLLIGVLTSLAVHIAALHIPLTQELLSLEPLDGVTWLVAGAVSSTAIIVNELHKRFRST